MSKARDLANVISGTGTLAVDAIPALPTSKITSGTFDNARLSAGSVTQHVDLSNLNADNLTSGTVPSARVSLSASDIPNLSANKITSDALGADRIPALPTSKITSGTFANARLSAGSVTQHVDLTALSADNLTSGTVPSARLSLGASDIPNLSASKITSDSLAADRVPDLPASKITSGSFATARIPTLDGSKISGGTFGAVNGSALTSLPSSAPTTSQVTSAMAGATAGSTGTFAMMYDNQAQTRVLGGTTAGTNLRWGAGGGSWDGLDWNRNPSGTWRCVGFSMNSGAANRVTCWLRIS